MTSDDEELPPEQEHDLDADVWQRHADGAQRDRAADREIKRAMALEQHGEYDADGVFRTSTWR